MSQPSTDARAVVRAIDALTTQVRRAVDRMPTPVVQQADAADDTRRASITAALAAEHYRRAEARIVASPEEHCAAMADAVMRVLTPVVHPDDDATTPATTCSARHARTDPMRWCIRAAHHTGKDHVDETGYHWSDTVAVYPMDNGVVKQWTPPVRKIAHQVSAEAYTAWTGQAPAADEDAHRADRRASLRNLINRAAAGLTPDEDALLRQHVEAELRYADQLAAGRATWKAKAEEQCTRADQADAVTAETKKLLERRTTTLRQRAERAEAAIERVRRLCADPVHRHTIARADVLTALDGTEQPTTKEQP